MSNRGKTLVKGHTLVYEGGAHTADGRYPYYRNIAVGHAKCSCGALSPELPSTSARKQWHRDHKDEMRTQDRT